MMLSLGLNGANESNCFGVNELLCVITFSKRETVGLSLLGYGAMDSQIRQKKKKKKGNHGP